MKQDLAVTYSLLAYINETSELIDGPVDIFVPLVKRALSLMNEDGIFKGQSKDVISKYINRLYTIDLPIPVLNTILGQIAHEVNEKGSQVFQLYGDGSFRINNYVFTTLEEEYASQRSDIIKLEKLFEAFCHANDYRPESGSVFEFIDLNRASLAKYLSDRKERKEVDFSIEARFVNYFRRIPHIYEAIKKIYIGSILVSYVEYQPASNDMQVELLLDTNFIIALHNLNTEESFLTCTSLLQIAASSGYTFSVLQDTIEETKNLLTAKARNFSKSILGRNIYPEDIYNACDRRSLTGVDLMRFADNLEDFIGNHHISVIYKTDNYKNKAKYSEEFQNLKERRSSSVAALHDATALMYVREKRGNKKIRDFVNVKCWFVNSVVNREYSPAKRFIDRYEMPEIIKADDLMNILWLSNPTMDQGIKLGDLADMGLSSLISMQLTAHLPRTSVIRELEDRILKYGAEEITDSDLVKLSTRIANNQLRDIERINELADNNEEDFIKRIREEVKKQQNTEEEQRRVFNEAVSEYLADAEEFRKVRVEIEEEHKSFLGAINDLEKEKKSAKDREQELLAETKAFKQKINEHFVEQEIRKMKQRGWATLFIGTFAFLGVIVFLLYMNDWSVSKLSNAIISLQGNIIYQCVAAVVTLIFAYIVKHWYTRVYSYSSIENFKKSLKLPEKI